MQLTFIQFLIEQKDYVKMSKIQFQYHRRLNENIWEKNNILQAKVRRALLRIAKEFFDTLEVKDFNIEDIVFTGSLANYNYTSKSDIDLHIEVDRDSGYCKECGIDMADLMKAKKAIWADEHSITVRGFPVEMYVQLQDEKLTAGGVYSIKQNKWIHKPSHNPNIEKEVDKYAVEVKAKEYKVKIDDLIKNKIDDKDDIHKLKEKIYDMRRAGLQKAGEFSVENLAFKALRNTGYIKKLKDYLIKVKDVDLSLD
jgi:predicted nucleotidyltransferase